MSETLLDASPSPGSYKEMPLTVGEINAHKDKDKIWATILYVRDVAREEGFDDGVSYGATNQED